MLARTEIAKFEAGLIPALRRAQTLTKITIFKPTGTLTAADLARHSRVAEALGDNNDKKNANRRLPPGRNPGCGGEWNESRRTRL